ncbi:MAG: flagellar biosynthesis anti-sigma factor FlgM [Comamonas sp.]
MKVGQNAERLAQLQQTQNQASVDKKAGTVGETLQRTTQAAAAGVPVTVSDSVRSLDVNTKNQGDIDVAKVRAMREAIANGTFSVNAGAVADKLLGDASDFLRPVAR